MPIRNVEHQKLIDEILFSVGSLPYIRIWPRVVGFDRLKKIRFGIPGESDIDGIMAPYGRRLSIEVKTGKAVLSDDQKIFRTMIEKFGGLYIEARSVDQVLKEIDLAVSFT